MKHAFRRIAWTLGAATLVAGLASQGSAAERRDAGRQPAVVPPVAAPTAIDRLAATRAEFHAILVDSGLMNGDVVTIVGHVDSLTEYLTRVSMENPDELGGRSVESILEAKTAAYLAQWGVPATTAAHLTALTQNWATERVAADVEILARTMATPAVAGSLR